MKKLKKIIISSTAFLVFLPTVVSAATVSGTQLIYKGGQTDKYVYSDIHDSKPNDSTKYKVWAAVKVGGNTYSSGWKNDKAYKQADRKWYANEKSYYDYYKR